MKFQRVYSMQIQGDINTYTISYPPPQPPFKPDFSRLLTLNLEVSRNTLASVNTGRFTLYNLKESTRRDIYHDRYDILNYRQVTLHAGYASQPSLPLIFQGNIISAYSYRRGPDWVTEIECYDGGFGTMKSQVSATYPTGFNFTDILRSALGGMQNVATGVISEFKTPNSRGLTLSGNTWDVVQGILPGASVFIDNERANLLQKGDCIDSSNGLPLITSSSGLLNTPRRQNAIIEVDLIFEPRAVVGQIIQLQSLETVNNGLYQVIGVKHSGTISGAVDGGVVTTLSLWLGTQRLKVVTP